jgi:hypothetical protein
MAQIDQRSKIAKTINNIRDRLIEHVGGHPDVKQSLLIDQCAWMIFRLSLKQGKMLTTDLTLHDDLYYLSWVNTLCRVLKQLKPPDDSADADLDYQAILAEIRRAA